MASAKTAATKQSNVSTKDSPRNEDGSIKLDANCGYVHNGKFISFTAKPVEVVAEEESVVPGSYEDAMIGTSEEDRKDGPALVQALNESVVERGATTEVLG